MGFIDRGFVSPTLNDVSAAAANTAKIQAALDLGGFVTLLGNGVVYVNDTLKIGDFTTLWVTPGIQLKLAPTSKKTIVSTKSRYNADKQITSLTSSGQTCTAACTAHGFVVGQPVAINWSSTVGYNGVFRVASVPDADHFTYLARETPAATTAALTTTAATSIYSSGNYLQARAATEGASLIVGGLIDYDLTNNAATSPGSDMNAVTFTHCMGGSVSGGGKVINARKYGVLVACAAEMMSAELHFDTASDGLHINGPIAGYNVGLIAGKTGDNAVGFGTGDYAAHHVSEGAVTGLQIDVVSAEVATVDMVRAFGSSLYPIDFKIGQIAGFTGGAGLALIADASVLPNGNAWIRHGVVDKVEVGSPVFPVQLGAPRIDYLKLDVVPTGTSSAVSIASTAAANSTLDIGAVCHNDAFTGSLISNAGTVRSMVARIDMEMSSSFTPIGVTNTGTLEEITFIAPRMKRGNALYSSSGAGPGNTLVNVVGGNLDTVNNPFNIAQNSGRVTIVGNGTRITGTVGAAFRNGGTSPTVVVKGAWGSLSGTLMSRTASQALEVYSYDVQVDVTILSRVTGEFCYNSNAAAGTLGAAGLVSCQGTASGSWTAMWNTSLNY